MNTPGLTPKMFAQQVREIINRNEGYPHTTRVELTELMQETLTEFGYHEGVALVIDAIAEDV